MGSTGAFVTVTTAADGDARPRPGEQIPRFTVARQVHGAGVVVVDDTPGVLDVEADALVSSAPDAALAVLGADCALLGLAGRGGIVGVAHAGWRGLVAGVVDAAVDAMRRLGAVSIEAVLGPCIHAECYEFGAGELASVAAVFGDIVVSHTRASAPALDLPAGVAVALERVGVPIVGRLGGCTACESNWFSHRARGDSARQALVVSRRRDVLRARDEAR